jgi:hypothetical protein
VIALAHGPALGIENHRADHGVGQSAESSPPGEVEGAGHPFSVVGVSRIVSI